MGDQSKSQSGDKPKGWIGGPTGSVIEPKGSKDVNITEAISLSGSGEDRKSNSTPVDPDPLKDQLEESVEVRRHSFREYANVMDAHLPSPFYPLLSTWVKNAEGDPLKGIRKLYDDVILDRDALHAEFASQTDRFGPYNRLIGLVCWREPRGPSDQRKEGETSGILNYGWVEGEGLLNFQLQVQPSPADKKGLRTINFYGRHKLSEGQYHHYVINDFEEPLAVNGVPIAKGIYAGPLPHFAVIDIGGFFVLWWGSEEGVQYVPTQKSKIAGTKRKFNAFGEIENLDDATAYPIKRPRALARTHFGSSTKSNPLIFSKLPTEKFKRFVPPSSKTESTVPPPKKTEPTIEPTIEPIIPPPIKPHPSSEDIGGSNPQSGQAKPASDIWSVRLREGLEKLRLQRSKDTTKNITHIRRSRNLADEEVALAIASVWEGLRRKGVEFAYGTTDCFRVNRSAENQVPGMTVVLQPNPLIMPLLFVEEYHASTDRRRHNPVGHLMLAVAERSTALSDDVKLIFMDSASSIAASPEQRAAAEGLVRYSGWMGVDGKGDALVRNPRFVEEWRPCPRQECGNTCGVSLILNAWAYMLGIPVYPGPHRRSPPNSTPKGGQEFHIFGLEIINLALAGHMNSDVIQAFMNYYGYSEDQDPNDPSAVARPMQAVRLSPEQLERMVHNRRQVEMDVAAVVNGLGGAVAKRADPPTPNPPTGTNGDPANPNPLTGTNGDPLPPQPPTGTNGDPPPPNPPTGTSGAQQGRDQGGQVRDFPAKDIAALEALGFTRDWALFALRITNGDVDKAAGNPD